MANIPTTVQQHGPHTIVTGTYAANFTLDASKVGVIADVKIALTGNIEIEAPTNPKPGQRIRFFLTSDASARTLTLDATILSPALLNVASAGAGVIAATKTRILDLAYNGTSWFAVNEVQAA
jgi:hypothetical protein